ncbi:MAG: alpha/beta hydrolase [Reichenbachiella sp.]|uniref:alpha/beta hydrolase n=1 Tax=Reichenbachiella sp. TaxID=2184521 RepID=UPI0032642EF4
MKVYCITGLGADESVFDLLEINSEKVCISWAPTYAWESMEAYAEKLCEQVDQHEPFVLLGVSLGGMLAVEMNKFIKPEMTILVTSLARRSELPRWIRWVGKTRLNRIIPTFLFSSHPKLIIWLFGVKSARGKQMVFDIASRTDKRFIKLSIDKVLNWQNDWVPENLQRIFATDDALLPKPNGVTGIEVNNAGHFAIVESAQEVSFRVDQLLSELN